MATAKTPKSAPKEEPKATPKAAAKPATKPASKKPVAGSTTDGPARFYGDDNPSPDMAPRPPAAGGRTSAARTPKPKSEAKQPAAKAKPGAATKGASTSAGRSSKPKPSS